MSREVDSSAVLAIDVEEWFHILDLPSAPKMDQWQQLEPRVEMGFRTLLSLMGEQRVHATCFFLGWIAERYPHLVKEAVAAGHEVASHGFAHQLVFHGTRVGFAEDIARSKKLLEDIGGQEVLGYRAPGFSSTEAITWFFEELVRAGYRYDASVFPAKRGHGGSPNSPRRPYLVETPRGEIVEFPATVTDILGIPMSFFGGGYLRLWPYWLIRRMCNKATREGVQLNFYVHPREVDPQHPRLPMNAKRRFKSYVGLNTMSPKLNSLMKECRPGCFRDLLPDMRAKLLREQTFEPTTT